MRSGTRRGRLQAPGTWSRCRVAYAPLRDAALPPVRGAPLLDASAIQLPVDALLRLGAAFRQVRRLGRARPGGRAAQAAVPPRERDRDDKPSRDCKGKGLVRRRRGTGSPLAQRDVEDSGSAEHMTKARRATTRSLASFASFASFASCARRRPSSSCQDSRGEGEREARVRTVGGLGSHNVGPAYTRWLRRTCLVTSLVGCLCACGSPEPPSAPVATPQQEVGSPPRPANTYASPPGSDDRPPPSNASPATCSPAACGPGMVCVKSGHVGG